MATSRFWLAARMTVSALLLGPADHLPKHDAFGLAGFLGGVGDEAFGGSSLSWRRVLCAAPLRRGLQAHLRVQRLIRLFPAPGE
jgi:hypothetical protein